MEREEVAALSPDDVAAIIASGGFETSVMFLRGRLIHSWYARRLAHASSPVEGRRGR